MTDALVLAISAPIDERSHRATELAENIAAMIPPGVKRAKANAAAIWKTDQPMADRNGLWEHDDEGGR